MYLINFLWDFIKLFIFCKIEGCYNIICFFDFFVIILLLLFNNRFSNLIFYIIKFNYLNGVVELFYLCLICEISDV